MTQKSDDVPGAYTERTFHEENETDTDTERHTLDKSHLQQKCIFFLLVKSFFADTHTQTDRHKCQTMKNKTYKHASSKICYRTNHTHLKCSDTFHSVV